MSFLQAIRRAAGAALLAAAVTAAAPAAHAQQPAPSAMAVAKEIVATTGSMAMFSPLVAGVIEQAKLVYLQQNPALSKDLNEIAAKMRTDMSPRLGEVSEQVAQLYARHFTEQELKDILVFYKSPVGKKLLNEQPQVVDDSMKFAQNWANALSGEVVAKMRDELKKKGHAM